MTNDGKYFLGTIEEFAQMLAGSISVEGIVTDPLSLWKNYDFASANDILNMEELSHEEIKNRASGWYGIRKFVAGFDDDEGLSLMCNYYGGGAGSCKYIEPGLSESFCAVAFMDMICKTIWRRELFTPDDILIAELSDNPLSNGRDNLQELQRLMDKISCKMNSLQDGYVCDADTVLADIMGKVSFEENGTFDEIRMIWADSKDKKTFLDLFQFFTDVTFDEYLQLCEKMTGNITLKGENNDPDSK